MEPISLIVGAVVLAAGFIAGRRARHATPTRTPPGSLAASPDGDPAPICACKHALAYHDPRTSQCHGRANGEPLRYDSFDRPMAWTRVPCTCRQYVGPIPAEQMLASFTLVHREDPPKPTGEPPGDT